MSGKEREVAVPISRNTSSQDGGHPSAAGRGITWRSLLIGAACVVLACWVCLYSNMIQKSSYMAGTLLSVAVIFIFAMVVLGLNVLIKLVFPGKGLTRPELAVVFIMTLLATCMPTFAWGEMFFPYLTSFRYYATPSNRWKDTLLPEIAKAQVRLLPSERNKAVRQFYEGLEGKRTSWAEAFGDIPWGDWAGPLVWWMTFFLPLFFLMLCVAVILRKQWMERERLVFPLMQLPLEIIRGEEPKRLLNRFFANKLLWVGIMLPVVFDSFTSMSYYVEAMPRFRFAVRVREIFGFYSIGFNLNWVMMGFTYLISLDIAFSLWFFSLAKSFAAASFKYFGWSLGRGDYYSSSEPAISHFCTGAIVAMVLLQLWSARSHLRDVFRKAFLGARDVDDSKETMSYRMAVFGGILCFVWMCVWWAMAGMQWWLPPLFILLAFAAFLALTRLVIEGGVPTAVASFIPQSAIVRLLGNSILTRQSVVCMGLCYTWISDLRVFLLPFMAHGVRVADAVNMKRRALPVVMIVTVLLAMVVTTVVLFVLCYQEGGINLNSWFFRGGGCNWAPKYAQQYVEQPLTAANNNFGGRWACFVGGGAFLAFLTLMRYHFVWWPLHPLGLPFSIPSWTAVMLAWVLKSLILKYGGVRLFQKLKPIFLGFILGQFFSAGIWFILDMCSGVVGHVIYNR